MMTTRRAGRPAAFAFVLTGLVAGLLNVGAGPATAAPTAGPTSAGDIRPVSVTSAGDVGAGDSADADVSSTGRFVAFASDAPDLVDGVGDDNEDGDVFVHDRRLRTTALVSVALDGTVGSSRSGDPSISADGRYVAFDSFAADVVAGDTNGANDVFVRDLVAGTTTLVSVDLMGGPANSGSGDPAISADGRYVAFESAATDLVDGEDLPGTSDVFVRDLQTGLTTAVSVDVNGAAPDGPSFAPAITGDGDLVAFWSSASDLVADDINGFDDVFVRRLSAGTTERVSVDVDRHDADEASRDPDLSADGTHVAFVSRANDLVAGDTNGFVIDVFVRDLVAGTTVRASVDVAGGDAGDNSEGPKLDADGSHVAFFTRAKDVVSPRQRDFVQDVVVRDLVTGTNQVITRDRRGRAPDGHSTSPAMSANGRVVALHSAAEDLVRRDNNGATDVLAVRLPR